MATVILAPPSGSDAASATKRNFRTGTAAIHATLGSADVLDVREIKELAIKPPASVTAVDVYGCETASGTFVLIDSIGTNGVVSVVASKWNTFDVAKLGPYGFLKFVSTGANGNAVFCGKS